MLDNIVDNCEHCWQQALFNPVMSQTLNVLVFRPLTAFFYIPAPASLAPGMATPTMAAVFPTPSLMSVNPISSTQLSVASSSVSPSPSTETIPTTTPGNVYDKLKLNITERNYKFKTCC